MRRMGNEAYPSTKVFHYLLGLPTAHFSRGFNFFLHGTFGSIEQTEELQPLAEACELGSTGKPEADTSDIIRFEDRLRRFNAKSDTRAAGAAMIPGTVPLWVHGLILSDVLPICTLAEFLRLFSVPWLPSRRSAKFEETRTR
jgi:hypothetical protein